MAKVIIRENEKVGKNYCRSKRRGMESSLADKILGMFYGVAMGDALGAMYEFDGGNLGRYSGVLDVPVLVRSRWQGTKRGVIGQVTDDTMMTLALLNSLAKNNGNYNMNDVIGNYQIFANSTGMVGKNTRNMFKGIKTIEGYHSRYKKHVDVNCESNGSLMRCTPLVFTDFSTVDTDCKLTNPNLVNREASYLYIVMLKALLMGYDPSTVFHHILSITTNPKLQLVLSTLKTNTFDGLDIKGKDKGWVGYALWCSLLALKMCIENPSHPEIYNLIIDKIIRKGGDTDTNAAIAGAVIGAIFGNTKLMESEKYRYNLNIILNCDYHQGELSVSDPAANLFHPKMFPSYLSHLYHIPITF